jgi:dTDP-D-glucose 4,6-dehydratase
MGPSPVSSLGDIVLITGGAGFIGGNIVLDLVGARAHRVINLDVLTYAGNLDTLAPVSDDPDHVFVRGNIGDRPLVRRLLAEHRPQAVVNFAAETHVDRSIDASRAFILTNVVDTLELLESALAYWDGLDGEERVMFRFLHVSTDEVYGTLELKATSPKRRLTGPPRRTPPRRPLPSTWSGRTTTPTAYRPSPPTAPTITVPTSSLRS